MVEIGGIIILLGLAVGGMYLVYRLLRTVAARVLATAPVKSVALSVSETVNLDVKPGSGKLRLRLADYFSWQVSVNQEKGTAGGAIKMDFPVKSSLGLGLICLLIAVTIGTVSQFLVPGIFLLFALYHFRKWARTLGILRERSGGAPGESEGRSPVPVAQELAEGKTAFVDGSAEPLSGALEALRVSPLALLLQALPDAARVYKANFFVLVPGFLAVEIAAVFTLGITCGPFWGGLHLMLHQSLETNRPASPDLFAGFRRGLFLPLVALFFLELILVAVGTVLGVLPGVAVAWLWLFVFSFAAIEGRGVRDSIRCSLSMVRANPWPNLLLCVFVEVLVIFPLFLGPVAFLGEALVAPFVVAVIAASFRHQRLALPASFFPPPEHRLPQT